MKRILLLLLALILLLPSCAPAVSDKTNAPQTGEKPQPTQQGTADKVGELYLIKDDKAACEVVVSVKAEWAVNKAAAELKDALAKKCKTDRIKLSTDVTENKGLTEILVGETKRALSKELYEKLEWNQIGVLIRDGKVAIGAGMEENLALACNWFRRNHANSVKAGNMVIVDTLEYIESTDMAIPEAPEYSDTVKPTTIVQCGDDNYLKIYHNTDQQDYLNYLAKLEQAGFTKVMDNKIDNNLYATYTNNVTDVHVYDLENVGVAKVVLSPASPTVPREENPVIPEGKTNDVYMFSTINFGLSMAIQLKDGRFIVIDGAQQSESRDLVNFLKSRSPEGEKAHIAAWIFTHAHPDHTYALLGTGEYGLYKELTVDNFVFNFPSDPIYENFEPDCINQTKNVREVIESCYPDAKVVKPHTGNQMILGDVVVDFLSTQEDVLPHSMNDFNDSSLVMRFTIDGQRLVVTGDMSVGDFSFCNAAYSDEALKCDIFQMPHHGHNTDKSFFTAMAPKLVLLPNENEESCVKLMEGGNNALLMKTATKWYGSYKTWKISMPFAGDDPAVEVPYGAKAQ